MPKPGHYAKVLSAYVVHHTLFFLQLFYPKQTDKPLYKGLVTQLKSLNIPMPSIDDIQAKPLREQFDVVVDSIFGFGFTGAPRPPFDKIIEVWSHTYFSSMVALACKGAAAVCWNQQQMSGELVWTAMRSVCSHCS